MTLSQLERVTGPRKATEDDIDELNELFSFSFTDRYRRDGLAGVRVPKLNRDIWRYAIRDANGGAMVWFDEGEELVAFNLAHHSGVEGWMGPLAVHPESQGRGFGKLIVKTAIAWLKGVGATTIGLETMPRTVENIGFYGGLGFEPGYLTMSLGRELSNVYDQPYRLLSLERPVERASLIARFRKMVQSVVPGLDFAREYELTYDLGIGDTLIVGDGDEIAGICLCHTAPLAANKKPDEVRVLKVYAESVEAFGRLIKAVEAFSVGLGVKQVSLRAQSAQHEPLRLLQNMGYRVKWTDLRMTLEGYAEQFVPPGKVIYSNWEI